MFPLLGRAIFRYLEGPQTKPALQLPTSSHRPSSPPLSSPTPTAWAMHNIYVQMIMDEVRKQQYDEVYGHLQLLYPTSASSESPENAGNSTLKTIQKVLNTIAGLCFIDKGADGEGSRVPTPRGTRNHYSFLILNSFNNAGLQIQPFPFQMNCQS